MTDIDARAFPPAVSRSRPSSRSARPVSPSRRDVLVGAAALVLPTFASAGEPAAVRPGVALRFPRDHGAHPGYRTEWWYITGWLRAGGDRELGFQVTFFRSRPGLQDTSPSRFAPKQLLFAHAAIADPRQGRLRHDQRAARTGFGLTEFSETTTDVHLDDWRLRLDGERYRATLVAEGFALELDCTPTQPVLLQGDKGYSRKGPRAEQASHYYSRPQLSVAGAVTLENQRLPVTGTAWLDHEWSSEYLAPGAVGWDWTGLNLDDGGALMAFRIRDRDGTPLWAGGSRRSPGGALRAFTASEVRFEPVRWWSSPRTGARYPVAMRVAVPDAVIDLAPLMDDQELDSRASVGAVYWEGAVRAATAGRAVGKGYLELTGYLGKLSM